MLQRPPFRRTRTCFVPRGWPSAPLFAVSHLSLSIFGILHTHLDEIRNPSPVRLLFSRPNGILKLFLRLSTSSSLAERAPSYFLWVFRLIPCLYSTLTIQAVTLPQYRSKSNHRRPGPVPPQLESFFPYVATRHRFSDCAPRRPYPDCPLLPFSWVAYLNYLNSNDARCPGIPSGTFLPPDCRLSFLPPALCNSFCWALVLLDAAILDVSIQCMAVPGRHKKALQPSVHNILWTVWIASSPEPSLLN